MPVWIQPARQLLCEELIRNWRCSTNLNQAPLGAFLFNRHYDGMLINHLRHSIDGLLEINAP